MGLPSRGRLQRIPCPVGVEDAHSNGGDREGEKDGSSQDGGGSRRSLLLVMEQGRGA